MKLPEIITIKAKIEDKSILVWWAPKWRPLRYYQGKGIPSQKIQTEVINRLKLNAGLPSSQKVEIKWEAAN